MVDGDAYSVLQLSGKPGSVMADGSWSPTRGGLPGCWIKEVTDGKVSTTLVPPKGELASLLRRTAVEDIVKDKNCDVCARQNPFQEGI